MLKIVGFHTLKFLKMSGMTNRDIFFCYGIQPILFLFLTCTDIHIFIVQFMAIYLCQKYLKGTNG